MEHQTNTTQTYLPANYSIETIRIYLKERLLDRLKTGDPLWDALVGITIISSQDTIATYLSYFKNLFISLVKRFYLYLRDRYYSRKKLFVITETPQIEKTVTIRYITEDREVNTLYEPVMWYLSNNTDTINEKVTELVVTQDKPILNQRVPKNKSSSVSFMDHKITYQLSSEMITIYGDREYKRENGRIDLTTYVHPQRNADLFEQFSNMCLVKYAEWKEKLQWKQMVYRNNGNVWTGHPAKTSRKLKTVVLKQNQMEDLMNDLGDFLTKEEWYQSRDIPYTRHYMFWGRPGTGKSSCIKALAGHTKRHLYYLILSEVKSDADLLSLMEKIPFDQSILVIEDIDCASDIVASRGNKEDKKDETESPSCTLTLSGLLNAIDGGMMNSHGRILIMTTNHPEKLDPALVRPGRVDRRYQFDKCDQFQIEGLYFNFFEQHPPAKLDMSEKTVFPAEITSIFLQHKNDPVAAWQQTVQYVETSNRSPS